MRRLRLRKRKSISGTLERRRSAGRVRAAALPPQSEKRSGHSRWGVSGGAVVAPPDVD